MKASVAVLLAIGLALVAMPASAQRRGIHPRPPAAAAQLPPPPPPMKTASDIYWGAVRSASGPIGFPQPTANDQFTRPSRIRSYGFGPALYGSIPFVSSPEPVYVPVYVPGPAVYVPVPADAPPTPSPAVDSLSVTPAPRRPEQFFVIPGCYAGNKPPQPETLPVGCDIQKVRVNTW